MVTAHRYGVMPDVVLDAVTGPFTSPFDKALDAGFRCSCDWPFWHGGPRVHLAQ